MSRWRAENIDLEIGGSALALWRGGLRVQLAAAPGDWPALAAELACTLAPRSRLAVRVADCWTRYWLLDPPTGVASLRDCRLLLRARFEALYGQSAADWLLQADWQAGGPMLACALPRSLHDALSGFALSTMTPELMRSWNRQCATLPASGVWCASADGMLNLLHWQDGVLRLVRQQRGTDADGLLALELARLGAAVPAQRIWSGRDVPEGWSALKEAA